MDASPGTDQTAPPASPGQGTPPGNRLLTAFRWALPALGAYVAVRAASLTVLFTWCHLRGKSPWDLLMRADAGWYLRIAEHGYDSGEKLQSNMAFFPLYPGLVSGLARSTGLDFRPAALTVAWLGSLAAAWGLFAIGNHLYDRRVGILLATVWGALPHGVVESMGYTEGLFTALAAWTLYALLRERWVVAGVLCLFAGLTRPTAVALIPVVGLAALLAIVRRPTAWRPWVAVVLAPLGWLSYLTWVATRTGRIDGWFHIQSAGWGSSFDAGADTARSALHVLRTPVRLPFYLVTVVVLLAVMLYVLSLVDRQRWQLLVFSGLLLFTTLTAGGYYHSKARFLLPAFPLLLPLAIALARARRVKMYTILVTLVVISGYLGGHLLLLWPRSP